MENVENTEEKKKSSNPDFEDFAVDPGKANEIRQTIETIKELSLVEDLQILIKEFGVDDTPVGESVKLPKFTKNKNPKVYSVINDTGDSVFSVHSFMQEIAVKSQERCFLEFILLPKNKSYAVKYVNDSLWEEFLTHKELFDAKVNEAKTKKAARQKNFKQKFS